MGPLEGLRVLEFAGIGPVPYAAMMLADMGAETACILPPGRTLAPTDPTARSRLTLTLDLKQPHSLATARQLAAHADILLEGFRPGVMERLGLGPAPLLAANPALVYGRMTGWGQDGPLAARAGHDINYIALAGALAAIGPPGLPPPPPLNLVGDYGGGALHLVVGVLAALLAVRAGSPGQVVDCAMVDGTGAMLSLFHAFRAAGRWTGTRHNNLLDGAYPFYRAYRCSDDRFIAVGALEPQFHTALLHALGRTNDPALARSEYPETWPATAATLERLFATHPRDHWAALCTNTDACLTPVLTMQEAPHHPHAQARQAFQPDGTPAPAPRFQTTPSTPSQTVPITPETLLARWQAGLGPPAPAGPGQRPGPKPPPAQSPPDPADTPHPR